MTTATMNRKNAARSERPRQHDPRSRRASPALLRAVKFATPLLLIGVWEVAARFAGNFFFPPPTAILAKMHELWFSGPFLFTEGVFVDIIPSLWRMLLGFVIATVVGVGLGFAIGRSRVLSLTAEPVLHFLRSTPGPALLPIFLILLGTDTLMRVSLIAFASCWPILLNTIDGVRGVDPTQLDTARAFNLPWHARLFRVILPSAMPKIFAGLMIALAISLTLMVVSELMAATNGIGYQIQWANNRLAITHMWAGIAMIAVLGLILNYVLAFIERRMLRWHRGARRQDD